MWCAYGFDPRKEPSAKIYQLIDFRLKGSESALIMCNKGQNNRCKGACMIILVQTN